MTTQTRQQRRLEKSERKERRREERRSRRLSAGRSPDGSSLDFLFSALAGPQPWNEVRDLVLPMLPRRTPPPDFGQRPVTAVLPPGIPVGFAIDSEHAFGTVLADLLPEWGIDARALALAAVSNLRRRAEARDPGDVEEAVVAGLRVRSLRPTGGWESALVLAPDLLERFFGPGPSWVSAPLRPLLLAFDGDAHPGEVLAVHEMLAGADPRGLATEPMRFEEGRLTVVRWDADGDGDLLPARPAPPRPS